MSRLMTLFVTLLAAGLVAWAVVLRSCAPSGRDGIVLALDPGAIQTIRVRSGADTFDLKRRGRQWQIASGDFKDTADPTVPEKLAGLAGGLFYHDRIPAPEIGGNDDLARYGLRSPMRWVEFHERRIHRLLLGKEAAIEGRMYARIDGSNTIYLIDDAITQALPPDSASLRSKTLTNLSPDLADKLILRDGTGEIELERNPSGGWRISKPLSAPADSETVENLLAEFFNLPIVAFVADDSGDLGFHGIEEGKVEMAVHVEGRTRPLVLRFGHVPGEFPGSILAQFTGRDAIIRLPHAARELLNRKPDDFRDRRLLPVNLDMVDRIQIEAGGEEFDLERKGDGWEIVTADGARRPASSPAVFRLVEVLGAAQVTGFSRQPAPETPPMRRVRFFSVLSENTPEAAAGSRLVAGLDLHPDEESGGLVAAIETIPGTSDVARDVLVAIPPDPADWMPPATTTPPADP